MGAGERFGGLPQADKLGMQDSVALASCSALAANFLSELGKDTTEGEHLRSPSDLCKETYRRTLAHHHTWWVRKAAELAFLAMPERPYIYQLVCVETQAEAAVVLNRVVRAIEEVYERMKSLYRNTACWTYPERRRERKIMGNMSVPT